MGNYRRTIAAAAATILASLSLYPIFYGFAWFWTGVAAVLTVAVAGTLTRLRRLPVFVCLAGSLVALLLELNIGYESPTSLLRVLPTPTSLRLLWDLVGMGFHESAKYAPPVPELPPMMFLATAGIGLTAVLTDLIAVRLESAALAGLPLLLLFTEPFTLSISRTGIGMVIAFCLGTAGYLGLLSSEGRDRIREWERPNPGPDELPDTRALSTTGRRVGVASVALALCVPLFIPGLHATRLFGNGQPGIGGTGGGTGTGTGVGFPNPNTQLSQELHESRAQDVLSYTTSDATPDYLQVYVLDNLTPSGWTMFSQPESLVNANPRLPAAPGLTQTTYASQENTYVTLSRAVGQDDLSALPVPYPATEVVAQGQLRADKSTLMVFDTGVSLSGLTYLVTSLDQSPPAQALNAAPQAPADITDHYTEYPSSYQPLRQIAEQVVAAAKAKTQFQEAVALQDWLASSAFTYTTNAPSIVDARGLETFLTSTKRGYCQQFSFAMAVLARLLGIPSRVAYGFTAGTPEANGAWQVTTHDAHAWPELYFQGYGWLRFEPTPSGGADGQGTATAPTYTQQPANVFQQTTGATGNNGTSGSAHSTTGDSAALKSHLKTSLGGANGADYSSPPPGLSGWQIFGLAVLGLLVLIMLVVAAPAGARLLIRRWRWRSAHRHGGDAALAHAAWRELRDDLVDYRAGYSLSESPRALAARVSESLLLPAPAMAALRRVAMAEERARYAARPDSGAGLREDSATVRRAIAAASPRRTRWLARLFPSSVITPAMIRFSQAADFSGRLNSDWFGKTRIGPRPLGRTKPAQAPSGDEKGARRGEPLATTGSRDR
jgi:transglutaminase-like putative cysteine protease